MSETLVRDRDGEMRTIHEPTQDVHICKDGTEPGWGPETADGRPRPCLACRQHLVGAFGPGKRFRYGGRFTPVR